MHASCFFFNFFLVLFLCFLLVDKIRADEFPIVDEVDEVLDVERPPLLLVEVEETDGGDIFAFSHLFICFKG